MGDTAARRLRSALAAGIASFTLIAGMAVAPAQAGGKTKYVALGDSYAAGQGAGPYLDSCYRSANSYAELADAEKAIHLVVNAACSGKSTRDVVEQQLHKLNKRTDLVTITSGGNNIGFGNIIKYCGAALTVPTSGPACDAATAFAGTQIQSGQLVADIIVMINSVRAAAPNARIVVTGYPYLYDPVVPHPGDPLSLFIQQATQLADGLNASIALAAEITGVQYVEVRPAFAGHGVNSLDPWINLDLANPSNPNNFHPNAEGYEAYFAVLDAAGAF